MLRPKLPNAPAVPATARLITSAQNHHAPAPCSCQHSTAPTSTARPSLAPYMAAGAGAIAGVLVVGAVLTALLAAVAITAVSVAVCAVVLRSLAGGTNHRTR